MGYFSERWFQIPCPQLLSPHLPMESLPLTILLFFLLPFTALLTAVLWLLQRRRATHVTRRARKPNADDRQQFARLIHDDIGQKFAAARINLSALRLQLRTGGVTEAAELDAAMNLLDDGCRDLRTVSRLLAAGEGPVSPDAHLPDRPDREASVVPAEEEQRR